MNVRHDIISERGSDEEIRETIVNAVAAATGMDPTDLPVFYSTLDPEALEQLCRSGDDGLTVEFEYAGCRVRVGGTGAVSVNDGDD
jgi:hypothetical protein